MSDQTGGTRPGAGSAMQRALAAEQEARASIAAATLEAGATIERARARVRETLNGVPGRITRLRERGKRAVQKAVAAIEAEEASALARLDREAFPEPLVERSVAAVARRLTGGDEP